MFFLNEKKDKQTYNEMREKIGQKTRKSKKQKKEAEKKEDFP